MADVSERSKKVEKEIGDSLTCGERADDERAVGVRDFWGGHVVVGDGRWRREQWADVNLRISVAEDRTRRTSDGEHCGTSKDK